MEATRKWRKGVRTYVAFEQPVHSEMSIAKAVMVSLLSASHLLAACSDAGNVLSPQHLWCPAESTVLLPVALHLGQW